MIFWLICGGLLAQDKTDYMKEYSDLVTKIYAESLKDSSAWEQLAYMCDTYGHRFCGSVGLEKSLDYMFEKMKEDGLENVKKEEVKIPRWVRGKEYCKLIEPREENLYMLGVGRSVGTTSEGTTAAVIVVKNFKELEKVSEKAKGKIVLFNEPFEHYGQAVQYRWKGAIEAAKYGAVASLCRSVSPVGLRSPHTGSMMIYPDTIPQIPHAAISAEDADMLQRLYDRGQKPKVKLYMEAHNLPDTISYNVMGELVGAEKPDEIIVIGGHSDCWDVGTGAHDDASGCFATWKALKILKDAGLQPKRTIRAVMWVNEENGVRGGEAYAEEHFDENTVLMFEFDAGAFPPEKFGFKGPDSLYKKIKAIEPVLQIIDEITVKKGAWGVDASKLAEKKNIPLMHLNTKDEGKYFWYHHSPMDTPDKIDPKDLNKCIASIAAIMYIIANMESL